MSGLGSLPAAAADPVDADVVIVTGMTIVADVCWVEAVCLGNTGLVAQPFNASGGTCSVISESASDTTAEVLSGCTAGAMGDFENVACGTGAVLGASASVVETGSDAYSFNDLNVVFVGGLGVIVASGPGDGAGAAVASGVLEFLPSKVDLPPSPLGACTRSFTAYAVLVTDA
ncbi:MAG TPA: hypothetical protein VG245_01155 [Candidatus Dormibacteraeota bacterium]|jgi:hypothetical protein|nr:hypothetical protein [Candidatus Dormibacteraeota bacterium]